MLRDSERRSVRHQSTRDVCQHFVQSYDDSVHGGKIQRAALPWLPLNQPSEAIGYVGAYLQGWLEMRVLVFPTGMPLWMLQLRHLQSTEGKDQGSLAKVGQLVLKVSDVP